MALLTYPILTYAWVGIGIEPQSGPKTTLDHIGNGLFAVGAVLLLVFALHKMYYLIMDKEHFHEQK